MSLLALLKLLLGKGFRSLLGLFRSLRRWLHQDTKPKACPISLSRMGHIGTEIRLFASHSADPAVVVSPCTDLSRMGHTGTDIATHSVDPVVVVSRPDTLSHDHDPPHASQVTLAPSAPLMLPSPPRAEFDYKFRPRVPECFERYDHEDHDLVPKKDSFFTLKPMDFVSIDSDYDHDLPLGWVTKIHPEGARYFYNKSQKIFTDAKVYESDVFDAINSFVSKVQSFETDSDTVLLGTKDLVIDKVRRSPNHTLSLYYYFADHETRTVFWIEDFEFYENFPISTTVQGATSRSHIRYEIIAQYWYHCFLFPTSIDFSLEIVDEIRDEIGFALCDILISPTSTISYSTDELEKMLRVTNNHRKSIQDGLISSPGFTSGLSRLMHMFVEHKFFNFHGQSLARNDTSISVYGHVSKKTFLSWISPLLFFVPDIYYQKFCDLWKDKLVRYPSWKKFTDKTNSEWQEYILLSTVLLTANVSFLGIQSVDHSNNGFDGYQHSAVQVSSYISAIASSGSIVLGLLLLQQHHTKGENAEEVASFLGSHHLESLAVYYSLPYSLMLWSTMSFLLAFSFMSFTYSGKIASTVLGAVLFAVSSLVLGYIIMFWYGLPVWRTEWLQRVSFQQPLKKICKNTMYRVWDQMADALSAHRACWLHPAPGNSVV